MDMIRLRNKYPEIKQFMKMPGIGPVGAHVFGAFIQTPHRFATKQKLWKCCRLGIVEHSSAGNGRTNGSTRLASVSSRL